MLDVIIRDGSIVDGTGAPARPGDVGIRDGRIVAVGDVDEPATRTIDADGKVVAPGFVDIHTHYDAQVFFDTTLSPSPLHGVTTVIGGNCGFTIAPLGPEHGDYLLRMLARVEGMSASALGRRRALGLEVASASTSTGSTARSRRTRASSSATRRSAASSWASARPKGPATPDDLAAMEQLLAESLRRRRARASRRRGRARTTTPTATWCRRGTRPRTSSSRCAASCPRHPGTTLEFIPCVGQFEDYAPDLMTRMSLAANRPLNWNVLFVSAGQRSDGRAQPRGVRLREPSTAAGCSR